jgi:hypothetical protein
MAELAPLVLQLPFDTVVVRCGSSQLRERVSRWSRLLQGAVPSSGSGEARGTVEMTLGSGECPRLFIPGSFDRTFEGESELLAAFERLLYKCVTRPPPGWILAHAAVLARKGKAYLFYGESGTGKSVLSLELAARGWTYLSDEFAPVGPEGEVRALPRPVTFATDELPEALRERLTQNKEHWTGELSTVDGKSSRSLYVLPTQVPPSPRSYPLGGVFRLEGRGGRSPRIRRLRSPEARALLFALRRIFKPEPIVE